MISIIVPSVNPIALERFKINVFKTIDVEYEIINYDNSRDGYGISKIYNLCAEKARFPYLIFCHDDILFHSKNWGNELLSVLEDHKIGLVGIAGAVYKSKHPAPWISIPQDYYRDRLNLKPYIDKENPFDDVAVLDGCFLAMRKSTWGKFKFDEYLLKGFHLYDIDLSIRILQKCRVVVTNRIKIEHISEGNFDSNWYEQSKVYHRARHFLLPTSTLKEIKENRRLNAHALRSLLFRSKSLKMPYQDRLKFFFFLIVTDPTKLSYRMWRVFL